MLMAFHLEKRWKKLFSSALYRSKTLHSTKVKFSQMTANDIEKFKQEVSFDDSIIIIISLSPTVLVVTDI
jgi:hypothetical protein